MALLVIRGVDFAFIVLGSLGFALYMVWPLMATRDEDELDGDEPGEG